MKSNNCIRNLLRVICLLQSNSLDRCNFSDCSKPFLGPSINSVCYNTRVITLYNKNGDIFTSTYGDSSSSYFRIQSVFDNCVTLLILDYNNNEYISTGEFITINISCIGAVKCIEDVSINTI